MPEPGPTQKPASKDTVLDKAERESAESVPGTDGAIEPPRRREIDGRDGLDPTRYGDWEYKGRCIDF